MDIGKIEFGPAVDPREWAREWDRKQFTNGQEPKSARDKGLVQSYGEAAREGFATGSKLAGFAAVDYLMAAAGALGIVLYEIAYRNAGWGVVWYEPGRDNSDGTVRDWNRSGLVVYQYYPTLAECIQAETRRMDGRIRSA